jgi:hypothetical protein
MACSAAATNPIELKEMKPMTTNLNGLSRDRLATREAFEQRQQPWALLGQARGLIQSRCDPMAADQLRPQHLVFFA